MKRGDFIRGLVSVGAFVLLGSHLFFRGVVQVDASALALIAIVILPWLGDIFESIDFPGGGGVKFRERVKAAGEVVAASAPPEAPPNSAPPQAPPASQPEPPGSSRHDQERDDLRWSAAATAWSHRARRGFRWESILPSSGDPNLQLVALRIEIEKRLAALVEQHGVTARTLNDMLRAAEKMHLLDEQVIDALRTLIRAGNMAAHGRSIDRELGEWVADTGPAILRALETRLAQAKGGHHNGDA